MEKGKKGVCKRCGEASQTIGRRGYCEQCFLSVRRYIKKHGVMQFPTGYDHRMHRSKKGKADSKFRELNIARKRKLEKLRIKDILRDD